MKFKVSDIKKQNEGAIKMWEREVDNDNKLAIFKFQLCIILKATLMQLEDDKVLSMYKTESPEEADITLKKVVSVYELGEEEISKFAKVKHIIKRFIV